MTTTTNTCSFVFDPEERDLGDEDLPGTITSKWECPHDSHEDSDRCIFHLNGAQRNEHDVTTDDIQSAFLEKVESPNPRDKQFIGAILDSLNLEYQILDGETKHPIDLRYASIPDGVNFHKAHIKQQLNLSHAFIGDFTFDSVVIERDIRFTGTTFLGDVEAFEANFQQNATFTGATFTQPVSFNETEFDDDVCFENADFKQLAEFRGADFYGGSNHLGDNTSFKNVDFHGEAHFERSDFEATVFSGATFHDEANLEKAVFEGGAHFENTTYHARTDFDEVRFMGDSTFKNANFNAFAIFRGTEFQGDSNHLVDDVTFEHASFHDNITFQDAKFRFANFEKVTFNSPVMLKNATFDGDADFLHATFHGNVNADEINFHADADFSHVTFHEPVLFRGSEFLGDSRYHEDSATFDYATFKTDADFDNSKFTSASFIETKFGGSVDFTSAAFTKDIEFQAIAIDDDTYVNMTDATIEAGSISQPDETWVLYDFTLASIGDVKLRSTNGRSKELLDYFRFCETEFATTTNEFDFSNHYAYFRNNDWNIHTFNENRADFDYAVEMTAGVIERTYKSAREAASSTGAKDAIGEFRVLENKYGRKDEWQYVTDSTRKFSHRARSLVRTAENLFLGIACGHGERIFLAMAWFVFAPLPLGFLFTFGGPHFRTEVGQLDTLSQILTPEGFDILFTNTYFAFTSYTTVGYGDFSPLGALARITAIGEAFVITIFGTLFVTTLLRRTLR